MRDYIAFVFEDSIAKRLKLFLGISNYRKLANILQKLDKLVNENKIRIIQDEEEQLDYLFPRDSLLRESSIADIRLYLNSYAKITKYAPLRQFIRSNFKERK